MADRPMILACGTLPRYWKGCRCDLCRTVHSEHQKLKRRQAKAAKAPAPTTEKDPTP